MIVTVKYVENSQKNWDNIKNQKKKKKKKIKAFKKKNLQQVYQSLLFAIIYVIIPFKISFKRTFIIFK